jgi:hypothetical protein
MERTTIRPSPLTPYPKRHRFTGKKRSGTSHFDSAPGADALIGRKHDPKAVDRVTHVIREIVLAMDSFQQETLLSHAHPVMVGLIRDLKFFVGFCERLIRQQPGVMHADCARL